MSVMARHPRVHHREHRIAQSFCGNCVGVFPFLDQHENLQIARCTSACERAGGGAVDHDAQTQGRYSDMGRAIQQVLCHDGSPGNFVGAAIDVTLSGRIIGVDWPVREKRPAPGLAALAFVLTSYLP